MKRYYAFLFLTILTTFVIFSCSDSEQEMYVPVAPVPEPTSPVVVDLAQVPYPKLSDYKFFEGDLKDQKPAVGLLPFEPASALFTDYAHKKRFVWMPKGTKATYNSDVKVLDLPIGAALVKNFYYENVQNMTPVGGTRIIETRVMIRKATGWIFANYVWNAAQTEAILDLDGSFTHIEWKENNITPKSADYRIPTEEQCIVCHKSQIIVGDHVEYTFIPIGIKPQNLNFDYNYGTASKNQLAKWVEVGYLDGDFDFPTATHSVIDYRDTSKSLDLRARSYVDANCSHCHQVERHCDYRPMRFAFSETENNPAHMGVCVDTEDMQEFEPALSKIVTPGNKLRSMMYHRLNTVDETYRMPLHGRTIIHDEGLVLIEQWINSLEPCP
jgi:uncharacterized repeat protein (TIGR03806 family)